MKRNCAKSLISWLLIIACFSGGIMFALPRRASAQIPVSVGGRFLPGAFDIYTFTLLCGVVVSVAGPNPGVFVFAPARIYRYFPMAFSHVGNNMLGLAAMAPPCPPVLHTIGSSMTP